MPNQNPPDIFDVAKTQTASSPPAIPGLSGTLEWYIGVLLGASKIGVGWFILWVSLIGDIVGIVWVMNSNYTNWERLANTFHEFKES
jgi:hypothetical protein